VRPGGGRYLRPMIWPTAVMNAHSLRAPHNGCGSWLPPAPSWPLIQRRSRRY